MPNPLEKIYKEMQNMNWGDLANSPTRRRRSGTVPKSASPKRSPSRGRTAKAPSPKRRAAASPRRFRSVSPAPENANLKKFGNNWKQYNAKAKTWKAVKAYNQEGDYGGPYTDPMKLFGMKKFRSDMEDIYGDDWIETFAKEHGINSRKIQEMPEYIEHLRQKYGLAAGATKAEVVEAARKARRAAKVAAKATATKGGARRGTRKGSRSRRASRKASRKGGRKH